MTRISLADARKTLGRTVKLARQGSRPVLMSHRRDCAAIVSMADYNLLRAIEDKMDIEAVRKALMEPGTFAWEDVKAELGLS